MPTGSVANDVIYCLKLLFDGYTAYLTLLILLLFFVGEPGRILGRGFLLF